MAPRCVLRWGSRLVLILVWVGGCRTGGANPAAERARRQRSADTPVEHVVQVFSQKPWLNLDSAGDRDPEGIGYRVFLDAGTGRGVLRDGTFHVEMYGIGRDAQGQLTRTLVSDWHYPTAEVATIAQPGRLGQGYFLRLRWATKEVAGKEIEVITRFEDPEGRSSRSGTKRLRVPKYPN